MATTGGTDPMTDERPGESIPVHDDSVRAGIVDGPGEAASAGGVGIVHAGGPSTADAAGITGRSVRRGDRVFLGLAAGSGAFLLVVMAAIAAFLIWKAIPALTAQSPWTLLTTQSWNPGATPPLFGVAALLFGTVMSALIAMVIGVPIAIGVALFISHYAARRAATSLGALVDLLAAVPSLVFGMWGLYFLIPKTQGFQSWLTDYFSWVPLFNAQPRDANGNPVLDGATGLPLSLTVQQYGKSLLMAGIVLAIMIIPVVSAVCREVFLQVPSETKDAAWALGSTKWEMIRTAVLPFGRAGMISAAMLGLGRALGETIAVALVLNSGFKINWVINEVGGDTFASTIALKFGEASGSKLGIPALITAGLFLFAITLVVNTIARLIIARKKEFTA
jgi:phosphate transport system permease protein